MMKFWEGEEKLVREEDGQLGGRGKMERGIFLEGEDEREGDGKIDGE